MNVPERYVVDVVVVRDDERSLPTIVTKEYFYSVSLNFTPLQCSSAMLPPPSPSPDLLLQDSDIIVHITAATKATVQGSSSLTPQKGGPGQLQVVKATFVRTSEQGHEFAYSFFSLPSEHFTLTPKVPAECPWPWPCPCPCQSPCPDPCLSAEKQRLDHHEFALLFCAAECPQGAPATAAQRQRQCLRLLSKRSGPLPKRRRLLPDFD